MSNRPLMFLGVFFVLIGIAKLGYAYRDGPGA